MRSFDWSTTPLGPVSGWPQSLKTAVRIMLTSRQPIWIGWGPELTYLYNDPYKSIIGGKHPWALGKPTSVVWREIWDDIGPLLSTALGGVEGTYVEAQRLIMERHGYKEETYYTFSYSPVPDDEGGVGGIICANTDDTRKVIGERRLRALRDLGAQATQAKSPEEACRIAAQVLAENTRDIPFALLYLKADAGASAELRGASQLASGHPAAPTSVGLERDDPDVWPVARVIRTGVGAHVGDVRTKFGDLPSGGWDIPPEGAMVLPIRESESLVSGALVLGVSPVRKLDEDYRTFFDLAAGQIATTIGNARAYEDERRRAEALAELDRAKTTFFSNVSHEFRTPLTLILGPIEDMLAKPAGDVLPDNRSLLEVVRRNALRLQKLVNTLLDFSRIEAGRVQASYEPTDLAAFTADLASVFRAAVEKAGIRFIVDCRPGPEPVYVDRDMWEKVVLNLLSNAFKFTLEGEIEVSLGREGDSATLRVRDTGTGISDDQLPHIFERFHRVEGARARTEEGTGIGLALVKELVKLHGGTVEVQSVIGHGTTFTVRIPLGAAHLPADRIGSRRTLGSTALGAGHFVGEAMRWNDDGGGEPGPDQIEGVLGAQADADHAAPGGERPRVVLADDNADMRGYLARLLGTRYVVDAVADGQAALEAVRAHRPDLVLTDAMMPRLDGFGLIRALRSDPGTRPIPVIMLSARAGEEARIAGLHSGADDYLIKPFQARELLARVWAAIELSRLRHEAAAANERAAGILESITDGFVALDRGWRFTYANDMAERLTRMKREELLGKNQWELFPATLGTPVEEGYRRAMERGETSEWENYYEPWGRWFSCKASPAKDGGIVVYFRDVTERKQAEETRQRLAAIVESSDDIIISKDLDGTVTSWNRGAEQILGYAAEEVVGKHISMLMPPDYRDDTERILGRVRRGEKVDHYETKRVRKDGTVIDVSVTASPIRDATGRIIGASKVARDITQQKRIEAERAEADRRKDEFLAMLAHELRNPLAAIGNAVHLTSRSGGVLEHIDWAMDVITRQMKHLTRLIDDLLDVSRISRGKIGLRRAVLDLAPIVDHAVATTRPLVEERKHTLEVDIDRGNLWVDGDPTRLEQVLTNLLNNAAKYSDNGGLIRVSARTEGDEVVLSIQDRGVGIPPEHIPLMFELFAQGDRTLARSEGGLGIGLTVVKKLVEMHGGTIEARSEGTGKGSEFTVRLPRARRPSAAATGSRAPRAEGRRARVLVVDDNVDTARGLARLLKLIGHEVAVAHDGHEAIEKARDLHPEFVLLDIGLPGMDGYKVASKLRGEACCRESVIIAVSGYGQEEDRRRSREAGIDHHLVKPLDHDALLSLLSADP